MRKVYREYTNGEITVEWRSELCNHSGVCINELPAVFNILQIPWVDMKGAPTEDIIRIVEECPTKALAWRYNNKPKEEKKEEGGEVKVVLLENGPIVIKGNIQMKLENGEMVEHSGMISLCRCGLSKKMPYCDGAHFNQGENNRQ